MPQLNFRPLCIFQVSLDHGSITEVNMAIDNLLRTYCVPFELPTLFLSDCHLKLHQIHQAFLDDPRPHIFLHYKIIFTFIILYDSCGHLITHHFILKGM